MIFTAPDQVLRFIGFGLMNLGEESGTGRISGAFNKASEVGAKMTNNIGGDKTPAKKRGNSPSGSDSEQGIGRV